MRYKNYVWPHNPRVYTIAFKRKMGAREVPFGQYNLQDLGPSYRIMRGEGEFVGEGAYDELKKLATVFYSEGQRLKLHRFLVRQEVLPTPSGKPPTPILWSCPWLRSPGRTM